MNASTAKIQFSSKYSLADSQRCWQWAIWRNAALWAFVYRGVDNRAYCIYMESI